MKFTVETKINLPLMRVIELFDNPDNMRHWQEGFISFIPISGTPGQPGAKSQLKYKINGREVEMIETITVRNLPNEFSGTYEMKGLSNGIRNSFERLDENRTRWVVESEFKGSGFMKVMCWLMPGAFKKQSQKFIDAFKVFAEGTLKND